MALGIDRQPLGAEALAAVDVLVAAPRPVHHGMLGRRPVLAVRHALHDVLQPRKVVAMADQHGIVHRHHDHVLDADHRGQGAVGADVGIAHVVDLDRPLGDVAGAVGLADVEQGVPGTEVGPAEAGGHDPTLVGTLHDRVVDRLGGRLGESLGIEEYRRADLLGLGDGLFGGGGHLGLETGHLRQQQRGREQEVAAVPQQPSAM